MNKREIKQLLQGLEGKEREEWRAKLEKLAEEERERRKRAVQPRSRDDNKVAEAWSPNVEPSAAFDDYDPVTPLEYGLGCRDCYIRDGALRPLWTAATRAEAPLGAYILGWRLGLDVFAQELRGKPLSQAEIAHRIGKSQPTVARWERALQEALEEDPDGLLQAAMSVNAITEEPCEICLDRAALGVWLGGLAEEELDWPPVLVGCLRVGFTPFAAGAPIDPTLRLERPYISRTCGWPESTLRAWERKFRRKALDKLDSLQCSEGLRRLLEEELRRE